MIRLIVLLAVVFGVAIKAAAVTYMSPLQTFSDGTTATLSITTDGTDGVLSTANITAFDITISDAGNSFRLTNANSAVQLSGDLISAWELYGLLVVDFTKTGYLLFQYPTLSSAGPFYCLQGGTAVCFDSGGPGSALDPVSCCGSNIDINRIPAGASLYSIGFRVRGEAAPEPATWGMLTVGFGLIGAAMRRRRIHAIFAEDTSRSPMSPEGGAALHLIHMPWQHGSEPNGPSAGHAALAKRQN